jgi:hypothetical protein
MRFVTKVTAALVVVLVLAQTPASALPYDPYPWCAEYSDGDSGLDGTNCILNPSNSRRSSI